MTDYEVQAFRKSSPRKLWHSRAMLKSAWGRSRRSDRAAMTSGLSHKQTFSEAAWMPQRRQ